MKSNLLRMRLLAFISIICFMFSFTVFSEELEITDPQLVTAQSQLNSEDGFKNNLPAGVRKLSSDLVQLLNNTSVLTEAPKLDLLTAMIDKNQYQPSGAANSLSSTGNVLDGRVFVYIYINPGVPITQYDGLLTEVVNVDEANRIVVAWVPVSSLNDLAESEGVRCIRTVQPPEVNVGSITNQADGVLRTDLVRSVYSQAGAGVKIGVISDGVDNMATSIATGDLPSNVSVLSNTEGGDEGTAMLELIYDLAPSAQLYFHDCGSNEVAFNLAVDDLIAAGCKIICDDIGWPGQPYFEDGTIAQHFSQIADQNNVLFVSSAGNGAEEHYQGMYSPAADNFHDFSSGGPNSNDIDCYIPTGGSIQVILQWDDPWAASANDYDLFLCDSTGYYKIASSEYTQSGTQEPIEFFGGTNNGAPFSAKIRVKKYSGNAKNLELFISCSGGTTFSANNLTKADSIFGHAAVPKVVAVGAIDYLTPSTIEDFSSQGPCTINGTQRAKPDISGIDGTSVTGVGGFGRPLGGGAGSSFYGTSAAAPNVAAVCALAWAQYPSKTPEQIRTMLYSSAVELGAAGRDNIYGYGRADAYNLFWPDIANAVFSTSVTKTLGQSVTIKSSGLGTSGVWFAPAGTFNFNQGPTMTTASGTATSIQAPSTPGTYKLYVKNASGTVSPASNATLTVEKTQLTITGLIANSKVYDSTNTATFSGAAVLSGVAQGHTVTLSGTASATFADKNVGNGKTVTVTGFSLTGADASKYTLAPLMLQANITKKELTVKADNKNKITGTVNPSFTVSYEGFVGEDTIAVLTVLPTASCNATQQSPAGEYAIVASGGVDENYSFTYVDGTLTINPPYISGDANGSGDVSLLDAIAILRHIAGLSTLTGNNFLAADVDCNGQITIIDAVKVLRKVAKLDP